MGFFDKLKKINIFSGFGSELTDDFYDELEESLILADTGMDVTLELVEQLRRRVKSEGIKTMEEAREAMVQVIAEALSAGDFSLDLSTKPSVVLFIGVNGVGKTTTTNAIAMGLRHMGRRVLCIDFDPQGDLSFGLRADNRVEMQNSIYHALKGELLTVQTIQHTPFCDVIAANMLLSGIELEFTGKGREYLLRDSEAGTAPLRQHPHRFPARPGHPHRQRLHHLRLGADAGAAGYLQPPGAGAA